jgi:hypothetical protein
MAKNCIKIRQKIQFILCLVCAESNFLFLVICYFLAITIWGGEFEYGVKSVTPISDILRPVESDGTNWNDLVQASLGYSYW